MERIKAYIKPDIINEIIGCRVGTYVTGSFIIGGATAKSDIDIVIPTDKPLYDYVLARLAVCYGGSFVASDYSNDRKLGIPGLTTINILQLQPLDYAAFMFATDTMRCAPVVEDRNARHRCFEELCHAYKSFINPGCVTVAEMYKVFDRHDSVGFMAEHIDWGNFYAR